MGTPAILGANALMKGKDYVKEGIKGTVERAFCNNNVPTIIDWESSGVVNPCEELLETAWDWSGGQEYFDEEKFKCFIHTYKNNGGDLKDLGKAIYSNFKNKSGWLEYNLKRVCKLECIDGEEQKLGEKEVARVIKEILLFYKIIDKIKICK